MKNKELKYSDEDIKRTRVIFLLFGAIVIGVILGTLIYCMKDDKSIFLSDRLNHGFIKLSERQSILSVFYRAISGTSLLVILLFLSGFCSISQPAEIFILFYRGTALGISISYIYGVYGAKGILVSAAMILPHALITSVVLVLAAREALRFSNLYMFYLTRQTPDESLRPQLKLYLIRFVVLMAFVLVSSLIDCVITYLLTDVLIV